MKKVLIITYYWPPAGGAGVQRWLKFVKYMRLFGWEPVVYTALNGEMPVTDASLEKDIPVGTRVIKTPIWEPYSIYKKFIGRKKEEKINASFLSESKKAGFAEKVSVWIRGNFFIPDARRFWVKPSISALTEVIKNGDITVVISSGPPHSMHLIAMGLKKKFPSLQWVADFRDPWTNIDFYEKLMLSKRADNLHHQMERQVLSEADLVISVGDHMSSELSEIYRKGGGKDENKFRVITNGFDEDDLAGSVLKTDSKFSIAHVGTLVKDRNPGVLWKVLARMVKDPVFRNALEIKLVGKVDIFVKEEISRHGLAKFVRKIEYLPHDEVIAEQQKSALLLLLINNTRNAKGILTGKFFEYMASGRPILAIGPPDGEAARILQETNTGLISAFEDELTLEKNIKAFFSGQTITGNFQKVNKYSRKELTRRLCAILDTLQN